MNNRCLRGFWRLTLVAMTAASPDLLQGQSVPLKAPIPHTLTFQAAQREYFVRLPATFDREKPYWALVVVHGGGGNGRSIFPATDIARAVADHGFDAIVISPSFPNDDNNASRFPVLREGDFLQEVLRHARKEYRLKPKILLTGYSRGGQFTHRFALAHPEQIAAVAPLASGTWTTPDGRFLVEEIGEVPNAAAFFSDTSNASKAPQRLRDLFNPRVAAVAEAKAAAGAREVPFLVMCGTLDPRLPIAKAFAQSLEALGYQVEVEWPQTPHSCGAVACGTKYAAEFQKYSRRVVEFFARAARQE